MSGLRPEQAALSRLSDLSKTEDNLRAIDEMADDARLPRRRFGPGPIGSTPATTELSRLPPEHKDKTK